MSSYKEFVEERDKIDYYIQNGYTIKGVTENLSGAFLLLESKDGEKQETLHILTADARKYFSSVLLQQKRGNAPV
ncbi:hypothetical protein [Priestia abyssalis]|uniref:hypothetical protein n=1 Tax=Priestia abyssalis TaxID=1221450 RepID=UPI000995002A|nr:hypothetical protein [Priestia abyssalis]